MIINARQNTEQKKKKKIRPDLSRIYIVSIPYLWKKNLCCIYAVSVPYLCRIYAVSIRIYAVSVPYLCRIYGQHSNRIYIVSISYL